MWTRVQMPKLRFCACGMARNLRDCLGACIFQQRDWQFFKFLKNIEAFLLNLLHLVNVYMAVVPDVSGLCELNGMYKIAAEKGIEHGMQK